MQEDLWRSMWEMAVDDSIAKLLGTTKSGNLSYFGVSNYGRLDAKQVLLKLCFCSSSNRCIEVSVLGSAWQQGP